MSATIVDFTQYRSAERIHDCGDHQVAHAAKIRDDVAKQAFVVDVLLEAQNALSRLVARCDTIQESIAVERDFMRRCKAATDLGDLDEMVRQRDALAAELAARWTVPS